MNKFLVTAVIILSLMVIDQGHALHQLGDINQLQGQTIDDYWNDLQADQQKYDADTAALKRQIKDLNDKNETLKQSLWQASNVIESIALCDESRLTLSACGFNGKVMKQSAKQYKKLTR